MITDSFFVLPLPLMMMLFVEQLRFFPDLLIILEGTAFYAMLKPYFMIFLWVKSDFFCLNIFGIGWSSIIIMILKVIRLFNFLYLKSYLNYSTTKKYIYIF